ncbi:MAG: hypothetical protein ACRDZ7_19310 [Acidimicrobiia bacterium]
MGSSGMRRKRRPHLPKVPDGQPHGTVPLGQDPPIGPYDQRAGIVAAGAVARAWRQGSPVQRRIALALGVVMGAQLIWATFDYFAG